MLRQLQQLESKYPVSSIAFSRDGRLATDSPGIVSIWEADRQGQLYQVQQLEYKVDFVSPGPMVFSPDGRLAIANSMNVLMWETDQRGRLQQVQQLETGRIINSVTFSPDGHQLATGGGNPVSIWEKDLQGRLHQAQKLKSHFVHSIAFSPDGRRLAAGGNSPEVLIWEADQQGRFQEVRRLNHGHDVNLVTFSHDGRLMTSSLGKVLIWKENGQGLLRVVQKLQVGGRNIRSADFSLDGQLAIAQDGKKGRVLILKADPERRLQQVQELMQRRASVAFSPNGRLATIAEGKEPGKILIWEAGM